MDFSELNDFQTIQIVHMCLAQKKKKTCNEEAWKLSQQSKLFFYRWNRKFDASDMQCNYTKMFQEKKKIHLFVRFMNILVRQPYTYHSV